VGMGNNVDVSQLQDASMLRSNSVG
jgi:hypothetical protein